MEANVNSYQWALRTPYQPTTFSLVLAAIARPLQAFGRAVQNRRAAAMLATMDDRMLADIGLNRSDLRDAYAEPLWRDPTEVLAARANERRAHRARVPLSISEAPPLVPENGFAVPKTDRPARYAL
jgi:uncharacterized protein YjiS (DUF1127 family)